MMETRAIPRHFFKLGLTSKKLPETIKDVNGLPKIFAGTEYSNKSRMNSKLFNCLSNSDTLAKFHNGLSRPIGRRHVQ